MKVSRYFPKELVLNPMNITTTGSRGNGMKGSPPGYSLDEWRGMIDR